MGHTSSCVEGSDVESKVDYDGWDQEASKEKNIRKWARDHICDTSAKNEAAFFPLLPKTA